MSIYKQIKDMPNPSSGLLNFFKRNTNRRIFIMESSHSKEGFVSLKKLKNLSLREGDLRVGSPTAFGYSLKYNREGAAKSRAFSGTNLRRKMFSGGRSQGDVCLVGIGHKDTGTWMLDVTERVIKELNTIGACALSKYHCRFEIISPRVKQCKFCGDKLDKKTKVIKTIKWVRR